MSLLETDLGSGRHWQRVGDAYAVTKKPRGLDLGSVDSIPFAAMEAIPQGGVYDATFTPKAPGSITSGTYFERDDVLVGKITPSFENGKQAYAANLPQAFGYATTEVIPLHPKSDHHDPRLLFFYLLHPDIRHYVAERMEGSTGRQRVPDNVLLDLPMPAFEKDDQTRMANALELIHRAITAESQSEANARELKNASTRELFARGLRGEPQKDSVIGPIPESWEVVDFDSAFQIAKGLVDPKVEPYASMLHIGPENIESQTGHLLPCLTAKEQGLISGKFFFNPGTIVYSKIRPYLNKVTVPDFSGICSADMYPLLHKKGFDRQFLFHFLLSPFFLDQAVPHQMRTGIPKLNREQLSTTRFPKPKMSDQEEIAEILDAIDRKIDLHKRKRAVLEELFRTLLHKLMTGEIDVNALDMSALPAATA